MRDPLWEEAGQALLRYAGNDDVVVLPRGDWPELPGQPIFYDDLIESGDATLLVLHKGRFGAIDKERLRTISETWQCFFGNDVFLCFSRTMRAPDDLRRGRRRIHYGVLRRFLDAKRLRRRASHLWYIHLPKAAGTWMWNSLAASCPSRIYYPSFAAFLAHPPDPDEYDVIGGHLPLSVIADFLGGSDRVVGLVREPTERMLSAFLHCRRPGEDPATFTAVMRAMREQPFDRFLQTGNGRLEACQQLIMLGGDHAAAPGASDDGRHCLDRATDLLSSARFCFAPCTRSAEFHAALVKTYRIGRKYSRSTNHTDYAAQASDIAEFNRSLELLQSINTTERRLYEFVARRFDALG
ncbi:MAG TPA: hypothetical protein VMF05_07590 [Stellaceae bacterium]|nr:hypothetical protein [Stellaceae bacterium]